MRASTARRIFFADGGSRCFAEGFLNPADLADLDADSEVLEERRSISGVCWSLMTLSWRYFCEQMEAKTLLNTTGTAPTLLRIGAGDKSIDEARELAPLIEPHFTVLPRVYDTGNIRDGDTSFRDVGGKNNLSYARRGD